MNKMIAMAVAAAFAAPMAAQADVKVSGQLQQELASWSGGACEGADLEGLQLDDGGQKCNSSAGGASAVGVSGSEDLGGGLKAVFKANFNLSVDSNAGLTGRDAYAGISGGFGTVLAGTMNTPYKSSTVKYDPMLATFAQARGNNGMSVLHNGYASNAIAYVNKFGGFKLAAALVVDEKAEAGSGSTYGNNAYSISGNFAAGPVDVALAYHQQSEIGGTADDQTAAKIGVSFNTGNITLAGQYESMGEGFSTAGTDSFSQYYLTGTFKAGANAFSLGYGANTDEGVDGDYVAAMWKHSMSKATAVHVAYRKNDSDVADSDTSVFGAGIRVKF